MFDPTNSDGQNSVNQREKEKKNKENKKKLPYLLSGASPPLIIHFVFLFFFIICVGPTYHILLHFLIRFSPETIYFVPVSISFILIEYSL